MMKAPHNEELPYSYCKLVEVSLKGSFADTKILKDILQHLVGSNFSNDIAEMEDALTEVFTD